MTKENEHYSFFFLISIMLGIFLRLWLMLMGHNCDFEAYCVVGEIVSNIKNVYANTTRYNYAFLFSCIQGLNYKIAGMLPGNTVPLFRILMVSLLILVDVIIAIFIRKKYSTKLAIIFFLNPVSIFITGYHNQFDNIAVLFLLLSMKYYNEDANLSKKDIGFITFFSLSLLTKHIAAFFAFWLLVKSKLSFKKRIAYSCIPPTIFFLSFIPFCIGNTAATDNIIANVFLYQSYNNAPLLKGIYTLLRISTGKWVVCYVLLLCIIGWLFRKCTYENQVYLYLICMVTFSSAVANQYLVIPMAAICILDKTPLKYLYMINTSFSFLLDVDGLNKKEDILNSLNANEQMGTLITMYQQNSRFISVFILFCILLFLYYTLPSNSDKRVKKLHKENK